MRADDPILARIVQEHRGRVLFSPFEGGQGGCSSSSPPEGITNDLRLGIYIHVPYCRTVCPYCDFVKKRTSGDAPQAYVDALGAEIARYDGPNIAQSIFFGGGTPSLLSAEGLSQVLDALRRCFTLDRPEVTLEANPDDVTEAKAAAWKQAGINRVSLGVQSFDDTCLRYLGRRHDAEGARNACRIIARQFDNWSLDLIFGAPPVEAWEATVAEAAGMGSPHISAYGLTYETGTPFEKRRDDAVDDETALAMYHHIRDGLREFDHYEISNFAKPGRQCLHNLVYWYNGEYAGFGPGAYSFLDGVRARNAPDVDAYLHDPGRKIEALRLRDDEIRVETVIQHLRLQEGLRADAYAARFGRAVEDDFGPQLVQLAARGLLTFQDGHYRPTTLGYDLNNEIGLALVLT